jgi:hypothetical protein
MHSVESFVNIGQKLLRILNDDTLAGRARWLARGNPSRRGETFSSDPTDLYYPEAF